MNSRLRSYWVFIVQERLGFRRPSPVTQQDREIRADAERRLNRAIRLLDATRENWSMRPKGNH